MTQEARRATKLSIETDLEFKLEFLILFGAILGSQVGSPNRSKICLGQPKDRPEASGEQFWSRLGPTFERFLEHIFKPAASPRLL